MNYLAEDELTQIMGLGDPGEIRYGPDGNLYEWVEGLDGLGKPSGLWRGVRQVARQVLPVARAVAPLIPGARTAATVARRLLRAPRRRPSSPARNRRRRRRFRRRSGSVRPVTPDVPSVAPAANDPSLETTIPVDSGTAGWDLGEAELGQVTGFGYLGELLEGPDGNLYQWPGEVDGLGNPVGILPLVPAITAAGKALLPVAKAAGKALLRRRGPAGGRARRRRRRRQARPVRVRPIRRVLPSALPAGSALTSQPAAPVETGAAGWDLGDEELMPGESLEQWVEGYAEELDGFVRENELQGLAEDDELYGLADDEALYGLAEAEELDGLAEEETLYGFAEHDEFQDIQGYVREDGVQGLEAYIPAEPPETDMFKEPDEPPEMWKPLW